MEVDPPQEDDIGRVYIKANFSIKDVRRIYDSICFYLQNGNQEEPDEYEQLVRIKSIFYAMLLEKSFHDQ